MPPAGARSSSTASPREAVRCCSPNPSCATAAVAAEAGVEVSLFVGPREGYGLGAHARSADGVGHAGQVRGRRGLSYAIEDVARAAEAGIGASSSPTWAC